MHQATTAQTKMAYGVAELAEGNDLSQAFLRAEIKAGRLRVVRAGRRVLVLAEDWKEYVQRHWKDTACMKTNRIESGCYFEAPKSPGARK